MGRPARRENKHDMGGKVVDQAGALCLRVSPGGEPQVLLVGSRRNGRWGLPKGHIELGETSHEAAAREAFEEEESSPNRYRVIVHRLAVSSIAETYPEQGLRARQWFTLSDAANVVGHEGLRDLLRNLD